MPFTSGALYHLFVQGHQYFNTPLPNILINQQVSGKQQRIPLGANLKNFSQGHLITYTQFRHITEGVNAVNKDLLWWTLFDLDRVNPRFRRFIHTRKYLCMILQNLELIVAQCMLYICSQSTGPIIPKGI